MVSLIAKKNNNLQHGVTAVNSVTVTETLAAEVEIQSDLKVEVRGESWHHIGSQGRLAHNTWTSKQLTSL